MQPLGDKTPVPPPLRTPGDDDDDKSPHHIVHVVVFCQRPTTKSTAARCALPDSEMQSRWFLADVLVFALLASSGCYKVQCRIYHDARGAPAPGPLRLGALNMENKRS